MTPDEWLRIKAIAADALAVPPEWRAEFVVAHCRGDHALLEAVQSLLRYIAEADDRYETPTITTSHVLAPLVLGDPAAPSIIGTRLGAYRIVSEIGRGGMGAAYLGVRDDDAYEKRVAIKLIKRGMDTDAILRRFRHERRILASLDHPNIVTLLDAGTTEDGLPYFVMEYVDGLPIDRYCDERRLGIDDRLRLFQAVCRAVHHAHERRVLHRDLKPGNILVTAAGVPKLLDFGIAKLLDPGTDHETIDPTLLGRPMTTQYASPEQIRGEPLTAASDVYSLGVLLYVLVAGRTPHALAGLAPPEAQRVVCEDVPARPSAVVTVEAGAARGERVDALRRRLSRGLDAIALAALEKGPADRYATAKDLADDIERHLNGMAPVAFRAQRATPWAWLRARVRRSPQSIAGGLPQTTWRTPVPAFGIVLLIALSIAALSRYRTPSEPAGATRAIAVLPLSPGGGQPDLDYLSEGIAEDVVARLSRIPNLKVIARNSTSRYRGLDIDPAEAGRELGADAVLAGSVTQRDGNLLVTAEVFDVRDRRRLWGARYDRTLGDIQFLQSELAQQIATSLRLRLSPQEQTRFLQNATQSAAAYHAYLKGRYFWNKRTAAGFRTSIGHFREAIERDPGFALAHAGLADALNLLPEYHDARATETYTEAHRAVNRALELDDGLAEAHAALGYMRHFYEWDAAGAERAYLRAIQLNPGYATAHQWYAEYLSAMGRHDEALAAIGRARDIDPVSLIINAVEAHILYMAGEYERAVEQSQQVIAMDPNFPEVYEFLKRSYAQLGRYADAIAARQARRRIIGRDTTETAALRAAAATTDATVYWSKRLEQEVFESRQEGLQPFEFAEILVQAGEPAQALDWLERACAEHDFMTVYVRVAPTLAPLRGEPRYWQLVERGCGIPRSMAKAGSGR